MHFHDLRHEGVSRLFEKGLTIPHVATVSGHRSWQSLKRYTHIRQVGDKYVGWQWLSEGIEKARTPAWVGSDAGAFLTIWVTRALGKTHGAHPDVQGWYGAFLQTVVLPHAAFWSYAVTAGEIAVGLGLILGLFTGIAAFFGTVMNASYLLAGTVSINPVLFALASLLVLAWKTAGWWGIDRWLLPRIGTPWGDSTVPLRTKEATL